MKTLKYRLIQNDETIIDTNPTYYEKDEVINFKIEDELYSFSKKEKTLLKKDKKSEIIIQKDNITIVLISEGYLFDMPIKSTIEINDKNIKIEYTLPDEDNNTNCILIELD